MKRFFSMTAFPSRASGAAPLPRWRSVIERTFCANATRHYCRKTAPWSAGFAYACTRLATTLVLLLALPWALTALETTPDVQPGLGPVPRLDPVLPRPTVSLLDDDQSLLRLLEQRLGGIDERIREILRRYEGLRPSGRVLDFPELAEARSQRDAAWQELQDEVQNDDQTGVRQDLLDRPADERPGDPEQLRLQAQNQLAVARCFYDLATAGSEPDADALIEGREVVDTIEISDLSPADRPFVVYYRFAFALEAARRSQGAARESHWRVAQRFRDQLKRDYPDSYLSMTADTLVLNASVDTQVIEQGLNDQVEPGT